VKRMKTAEEGMISCRRCRSTPCGVDGGNRVHHCTSSAAAAASRRVIWAMAAGIGRLAASISTGRVQRPVAKRLAHPGIRRGQIRRTADAGVVRLRRAAEPSDDRFWVARSVAIA
jgi:hypothetical protein